MKACVACCMYNCWKVRERSRWVRNCTYRICEVWNRGNRNLVKCAWLYRWSNHNWNFQVIISIEDSIETIFKHSFDYKVYCFYIWRIGTFWVIHKGVCLSSIALALLNLEDSRSFVNFSRQWTLRCRCSISSILVISYLDSAGRKITTCHRIASLINRTSCSIEI